MAQQFPGVWIQIAGNSKRIKGCEPPPHWRYRINDTSAEVFLLSSWAAIGEATPENHTQGTNSSAKGEEFIAWVLYFGDVEIDTTGHATIRLKTPSAPLPKSFRGK